MGSGTTLFEIQRNHAQPTTRPRQGSSPTPAATASAGSFQALEAVAASDLPEIVTIVAVGTTSEELGTGWPIDSSGDFITNDHVVRNGQSFHVLLPSGVQFSAEVVNDDPSLDLAEVHAWGFDEAPFTISDSLPAERQSVVVLAAQGATGHSPVTNAEVDGLDQSATVQTAIPGEPSSYSDLIRLGAQIYPGNSGGPVLDAQGQVVGILTLAAESGSSAFAIPTAEVDSVIQSWLKG